MCVALYKDLRDDPLVRRGHRSEVALEQAVTFGTQNYGDNFYMSVKPRRDDAIDEVPSTNGQGQEPASSSRISTGEDRQPSNPA
jgi:hypothetical protein